ncbi:amidohydrolase [Sedimentibacter sp.]|uniref:amidohydrolase n=1 Tax=Sedimentibacter sp. TaxID=1960295 RepID=UPI002898EC58|nr:amidohydrolase [Sedimentibacter sp.]
MKELKFIEEILKKKKEKIVDISDRIWEFSELPYDEYNSCRLLTEALEDEGFIINRGVADMPTAFTASFGNGKPVFGFLGEYDALDKLSQTAGCTERNPVVEGKPGHGCGHNLLGAGSLGAALVMKEYLSVNKLSGTVIYFGCPAEEGAGSKQFMARAGLFDDVDFVYTWHPASVNRVQSDRTVAIMGANFKFKGLTSHAGGSPHLGRSALDAAELMSVGVNYLREHMIDQARIHYAYVDAGGVSPNVVQDRSLIKYEVRSPKVAQVKELFERVVKVAKGAALMTETEVDYEITMAFSDYIPNAALAEIADEAFKEVGAPKWDEEDYNLAKEYLFSYNDSTIKSIKEYITEEYGEERMDEILDKPLDSEVHPYEGNNIKYVSGSTDVGDVCYAVPTINFNVATACIGNVGHTWQMTGQSRSSIAYKGLLTAVKVMTLSAIKTMKNPEVTEKAKDIVLKQNGGAYECPLPDSIKPPIGKY